MATYIVGDLHGCFNEFQLLLEKVNYNPKQDELFLTGDLVARGEDSLACLRFVKDSANNAKNRARQPRFALAWHQTGKTK